ncbi:MAG: protein kinase [Planctomycetes bacterium]|nr:protein kinase [Planctomycetota bacterium]
MVSSELGACEWFVWDLRRSGLIDRGQLDQVIGEFLKRNPRAEPPALADYLVGQGILSPFQAERILTGKTQGLVLGPYVLVDSIGAGSMGQVFKASSKTDNQMYAVKVLPRRSMWNVRLARRQVRAFSQFSHEGVVPFVDVGTSGGLHYLVWPFIEGETLEAKVERDGKLKPEMVAKVGFQIAQALNICHQNGIFHGLIKPSNVMITRDGQAKMLDFGIGSLLVENEGESLVDTMSTANTLTSGLDCSSPESIMEPTNRTTAGDQYSLGCVLYFALAGRYPFPDGTAVEKMMAHQFKQPQSLREIVAGAPEGLIEVIERLLQKAPDARFSGVDELVDNIQMHVVDSMAFPALPNYANTKIAAPRPEPVRAHTPLPGPTGLPLPSLPKQHTQPVTHMTTVSTPPPMAPVNVTPRQPIPTKAPPTPIGVQPVPVPKPPLPTRQSMQPAAPSAPVTPPSLPAQPALPTPARAQPMSAPAWVPEEQRRSSMGPILIVLVTALVTVAVYMLGKNFLFPGN